MAELKQAVKKAKKARKKFLEVDVWRSQFGPVSERAVYDIYSQKFNVESHNMKKYSFPHCVNALRLLENPEYIAPDYGTDTY
jgi:hypothetical protein